MVFFSCTRGRGVRWDIRQERGTKEEKFCSWHMKYGLAFATVHCGISFSLSRPFPPQGMYSTPEEKKKKGRGEGSGQLDRGGRKKILPLHKKQPGGNKTLCARQCSAIQFKPMHLCNRTNEPLAASFLPIERVEDASAKVALNSN